MGPVGVQEMIVIFLVALLLFGPKKLPELGRLVGKGLSEFKKAKSELKSTFDSHMRELERETQLQEQGKTASFTSPASYSSPSYPYPYDEYGRSGSEPASAAASGDGLEPYHREELNGNAAGPAPAIMPAEGSVPRTMNGSGSEPVSVAGEEKRPA